MSHVTLGRHRPAELPIANRDLRLPGMVVSSVGLGIAAGFTLISVVTALLVALGRHVSTTADLGVLTAMTAGMAVLLLLPAAAFTAGFAWLCLNGFLIDRFAVLRWHGWVDAERLLILMAVAALVVLLRAATVWLAPGSGEWEEKRGEPERDGPARVRR